VGVPLGVWRSIPSHSLALPGFLLAHISYFLVIFVDVHQVVGVCCVLVFIVLLHVIIMLLVLIMFLMLIMSLVLIKIYIFSNTTIIVHCVIDGVHCFCWISHVSPLCCC
jgi:hypothetical protein